MALKINRLLMGFGLLAGLMLGIGNTGGAITIALAGATGAWLLRTRPGEERSLW
ncbi:MAG: hypothetical protein RBT39_05190 [Azoarcus sp.]|jgi:hypothetical protein|nr:hypothetical protein [Azoarcus sp.]MDX9836937.1 hypothetical protein [Azoarcus sp.]